MSIFDERLVWDKINNPWYSGMDCTIEQKNGSCNVTNNKNQYSTNIMDAIYDSEMADDESDMIGDENGMIDEESDTISDENGMTTYYRK